MRYGILCELQVLHDYFLNSDHVLFEALGTRRSETALQQYASDAFVEIAPTASTVRTLRGHKLIFKSTGRGFLIGVQLDESAVDDRPVVTPGPDFWLTFSMRIVDPKFFIYTALPEDSGSVYRVGNDSGNQTAGGRHLSAPIPAYDPLRSYPASDVYSEPAGATVNLFQAVRDTGPSAIPVAADWTRIPADTHDTTGTYSTGDIVLSGNGLFQALVDGPGSNLNNAAEWDPIGTIANQYLSRADSIERRPGLFDLDVSSAALTEATIQLFRAGQVDPVYDQTFTAASGNLQTVQVDARNLPAGRYSLTVLDSASTVQAGFPAALYIDSLAFAEQWLGVIEIGLGSGDLSLFTNTGSLRSPQYTLRFLNRATWWRYIFPQSQTVGTGAEVSPEDAAGRILLSDASHLLTRYGTGLRLRADDIATPGASEEVLLPEPDITRIRKQNSQWFSEIQMSNYPPLT